MPRLDELGTLRIGLQIRGPAAAQSGGRHPVIQLGDVQGGAINFGRVVRMDFPRARPKDFLAPGDLLLRSRGASYGAAAVAACPEGTLAAAPLYVLRLETPHADPEYVAWFINRPAVQAALEMHAHGTHIPTVGLEAFAALEVALPSPQAQRRILDMERLYRQEKELTARRLERRGRLVRSAQEIVLGDAP